jgi:hypothetical protein
MNSSLSVEKDVVYAVITTLIPYAVRNYKTKRNIKKTALSDGL